ncbi:MAG TPA: DUF4440 domain-containing protein [Myxococcota bacterium]|nr:DUF4440 domain-containing protein [Myxococcota bacterium]
MRPALAAAAVALAGCAHSPAMDAPASLAAAEAAFAAHSVREDMRAAFLAHFAADGVFVRDGWTNASEFLRTRPAPSIVLDWRAQYVEVAASGDLGLSTGPWRITPRAGPAAPPAYGQFVSVWRRGRGGAWKVAADLGIAHPGPALWDAPLEAATTPGVPAAALDAGIAGAEQRFARDDAEHGARAAYAAHAARDLRFYRTGHAPVAGREAALAAAQERRLAWTAERIETAAAADFGYARGRYADAARPGQALGWYLRVWRREPAGWRIVLDVTNPAEDR